MTLRACWWKRCAGKPYRIVHTYLQYHELLVRVSEVVVCISSSDFGFNGLLVSRDHYRYFAVAADLCYTCCAVVLEQIEQSIHGTRYLLTPTLAPLQSRKQKHRSSIHTNLRRRMFIHSLVSAQQPLRLSAPSQGRNHNSSPSIQQRTRIRGFLVGNILTLLRTPWISDLGISQRSSDGSFPPSNPTWGCLNGTE